MGKDKDTKPECKAAIAADAATIMADRLNWKKALAVLGLTPKVFRLVWQITPLHIGLLLVLRAMTALVPIVQLWLGKVLIDAIIAVVSGTPRMSFVFMIVAIHGLLGLLGSAVGQVQAYVQDYVGRRLALYSDFLLREKVLGLDLAMLENSTFYDQYMRASAGAGSRPLNLVNEAMSVIESSVTLLSLGAVFLVLKWPITVILIVTTIPSVYVLLKFSQKSYDIQRARTQEGRRAAYHATLLSMPQSYKEVKILQIGGRLLHAYRQFKWREFREDRSLLRKRQAEGFLTGAVATLAYYGAYVYIVYEASRGHITVGDVAFYSGAFSRCQTAVRALISVVPNTYDINVYLKDFFDLQRAEPELVKTSGTECLPRPITSIEFRNVSFRYPRTDKWVLRNINLTFRSGERIGLVGENGAGKTTFVKLLCRLYDPTEGAIYVNGIDLREFPIERWHESIGVIFQDFVTYLSKIRENIGYGQVDAMEDLSQIIAAAEKGRADAFIRKLPEGYETVLGREFSGGEWLSGGQMQRLALSRLFMRKADVFILDEPTFALDPRSEYEIYETFDAHCAGKIGFLISHRFSTMRIAERIVVLNGQVLEDGTHAELMRLGGVYADLFEIQSKALRRDTDRGFRRTGTGKIGGTQRA